MCYSDVRPSKLDLVVELVIRSTLELKLYIPADDKSFSKKKILTQERKKILIDLKFAIWQ